MKNSDLLFDLPYGYNDKLYDNDDYNNIQILINATQTFAKITHQSIYIIDNVKKEVLYVSENFEYWFRESPFDIVKMGYEFLRELIPKEEEYILENIHSKFSDLFSKTPISERLQYSIKYDTNIVHNKKYRLANHHVAPMTLSKDGHAQLVLCSITMSARKEAGNIVIKKTGDTHYHEYLTDRRIWIKKEIILLNEIERDIIMLSAQGYTMNSIADKLFKSIDTIKTYKRILFLKLNVNNIVEALSSIINS